MIGLALGLATLLLTLAPAAYADDFPARKPGLWEITMNTGRTPPQVMRFCIDAATDAEMRNIGQNAGSGACGRPTMQRSGNVLTSDTVCHVGTSEMITHTVTTLNGDAGYHADIAIRINPPTPGGGVQNMTQDAKWSGPCGAGMKPGDIMTPQGKMNIRDMPHRTSP